MSAAPLRHRSDRLPVAKPSRPAPGLSDEDRRAILGVCDHLIGAAGRTTLALALRGSRAQRVVRYRVDQARGYGFYAGASEADVLARIDALIAEGILRIEYRDGFPLLGYTNPGLELAKRYAAEEWLGRLRSRVQPVANGSALELPWLMAEMPERNLDTVRLLTDLVAREADIAWRPLLREWQAAETRRVQGWLAPIIATLETNPPATDRR